MKTDICIVGGGIMGLSTAYNIRKNSNSRILVLDRYGIGNEFSSSNDVNRVFRYSYGGDELYTKMAVESRDLWKRIEKESGNEILVQTGLLLLQGQDENANRFNETSFKTLSRLALGAERIDQHELKKRFPQFRADEAFFDPHGGLLLASIALRTLHSLSRGCGVTFREERVTRIASGDHPLVTTESQETIECVKVVVTVGPWTNSLRPEKLVPIRSTRQQLFYFRPKDQIEPFRPARCPVFFADKHYGLPAGGIDAVKVSAKELVETVDPETARRVVDDEQVTECRNMCRKFVPGLANSEVVRTKVCLYDMTDNADFVIDRDPENRDLIYGYGFSGHGFKFAPLIGKLLAELALDKNTTFDLGRFSATSSSRIPPTVGAQLGQGQ